MLSFKFQALKMNNQIYEDEIYKIIKQFLATPAKKCVDILPAFIFRDIFYSIQSLQYTNFYLHANNTHSCNYVTTNQPDCLAINCMCMNCKNKFLKTYFQSVTCK